MAKIRDFFNSTDELDQFLLRLEERDFVKIVANGQKLAVFSGAHVIPFKNKLAQVQAGKLTKVINLPVLQDVAPVAKKGRRRH